MFFVALFSENLRAHVTNVERALGVLLLGHTTPPLYMLFSLTLFVLKDFQLPGII